IYFVLTVSGFSFWFFIAAPFASHRESYSWLAEVWQGRLRDSLTMFGVGTTWRPFGEFVTLLGFTALNPRIFPTSALRQALLQGFVYMMFVAAWAVIYFAARERRTVALVALVAGGIFFPGYIHLFHIHGLYYAPVLLTLGIVLRCHMKGYSQRQETALA